MSSVAVDIVLIPDADLFEKCIELNSRLREQIHGPHTLNPETCIPHISLCMCSVDKSALPEISKKLESITKNLKPISLSGNVESYPFLEGKTITHIVLRTLDGLQELHELCMNTVEPFEHEVSLNALYPDPPPDPVSTSWIKNYRSESSFENFSPHITLGLGELPDEEIEGTSSTLAICHLGNFCTCRKVLEKWQLT